MFGQTGATEYAPMVFLGHPLWSKQKSLFYRYIFYPEGPHRGAGKGDTGKGDEKGADLFLTFIVINNEVFHAWTSANSSGGTGDIALF